MSYKIEISDIVRKTLRKMDPPSRKRILSYVVGVLAKIGNPRLLGKALTGDLGGFWRYRVGNFRIICKIDDGKLVVLVVKISHRKDVYEN